MPIDLDKYKGKTLDGETLAKLTAELTADTEATEARVTAAEEKARKAAKESIEGRKTLKAERDKAFEKLGIDSPDELDTLPDAKGQGEATKQIEARLKKAERERDEAIQARDSVTGEVKAMKREASLSQALEGLKFKNPADVRVLLQSRVVEEGDELRFKTDDGKLVPLKDGAAWFAKTRPDYVEAADAGGQGSGFKGGAGGNGGSKSGDFGGDKDARKAAIASKFPELANAG
jgi:hypothetical protein